jgi:hypothetical protein
MIQILKYIKYVPAKDTIFFSNFLAHFLYGFEKTFDFSGHVFKSLQIKIIKKQEAAVVRAYTSICPFKIPAFLVIKPFPLFGISFASRTNILSIKSTNFCRPNHVSLSGCNFLHKINSAGKSSYFVR